MNAEQVSDTILFQHEHITNPTITHEDRVIRAIDNLQQTVKGMAGVKGDTAMHDLEQLTTVSHNLIKCHSQLSNTNTQIQPSSDMAPQQTRLHTSPRLAPTNTPTHSPRVIPEIQPAQYLRVDPMLPPIQSPSVAPIIPPTQAPRVTPTISLIQSPRVTPRLPSIQDPKVIRGISQQPTPSPIATQTQNRIKVPAPVPKEDPTK